MPLANSFLSSPDEFSKEPTYPLAVSACPACGLVQLDEVVPAESLYRNYIYVSGTSESVRAHVEALAGRLIEQYGWGLNDRVAEIASNDGTALIPFKKRGLSVLGIEPARNLAAVAEKAGVPTVSEFFNESTARDLAKTHGLVRGLLARHVFAHVDDLHDFLRGVAIILSEDGRFVVEVPYLGELIRNLEFDTIYHEHLSYFSLAPVERICREHGLRLVDVEWTRLHGGSMILHIAQAGAKTVPSPRLVSAMQDEVSQGLSKPETFLKFAKRVADWKDRFQDWMEGLNQNGARWVGYGAAAKANTLLNFCPSVAKNLTCILDRSPYKQGRFTPGTHVPVEPAERWESKTSTHMLILAWNFQEEIRKQMKPFADRGGRFAVPIPEPRIL